MKFKSLSLIAAFAFSGACLAQTPEPKITYTTVAVPVGKALAEVSKQAGTRLTVAPAVASDIIVLSLKNASLEDVKIQIAKACSAKWEAIEGGEMLVPDLTLRRQQEQKEQSEYTQAVAKSLKRLVDSLNPPKPDAEEKGEAISAARAQMAMFAGGGASGRAVIRIAQAIGANGLAAIPERGRVVYASTPNRMQRPLPGTTNAILAQLVTDYNKEVEARRRARSEAPIEPVDPRIKRFQEMFGIVDDDVPVEGTPTKAILVCTRQPMFGGITMTLKVFNDQGKVVISGQQMVSGGDSMMEALGDVEFGPDGLPKEKPQSKAGQNEKPIEFSASTKELMAMSNIMTMSSSPNKMNDSLKSKLLNPEQYDPLSFMHSEALIGTAAQRQKNLVAVLPDEMDSFMGMMMNQEETMTPSSYLESVSDSIIVNADGPIILIRPAKPAKARSTRIDRAALGQFLRAVDSKGTVTLDDLADYAEKSNSPMEDSAAMAYFMIFAPNAIQSGMAGMVSWDMLRFYGALSVNQKRSLAEGNRMAFSQFNPTQVGALRQMVFGAEQALVVDNPDAQKMEFEIPTFIRGMMGQMGGDYRSEPTEVMPNGLPSEGYLEMKVTQDNIAKPTGNVPAMFGNAALGADELAMLKLFKDMPGMEQMSSFMPNIEEVRLGERSVYDFKFTVAQGVYVEKSLNDDRMTANSPVVKLANLPAGFAKKIEDRLAAFKKMPFFDPAFMNPQRGTPPPAN